MSTFSPLDSAALVGVSLAAIALAASACPPLTPKEDTVQNSAQGSAEDTDQSASQIDNCRITPLSGVSPDTLGEFRELFPETKTVSSGVLLEELTKEVKNTGTMGITPEEYFENAIEAVRMNDEAMRRTAEEATGNAPMRSH